MTPTLLQINYELQTKYKKQLPKGVRVCVVAQSCLTLCNPMDHSPPGSSVHAISQVRILEWVTIPFSRASSHSGIKSGSPALQADSIQSETPGKPIQR